MPRDTDSTDTDRLSDERPGVERRPRPGVERRPLLKALGGGAALAFGSGVAAAEQDAPEIDPVYGYSVQDAGDVPTDLRPDREVELTAARPDPEAGLPPAFHFEPVGLHADAGDVVQFTFSTPDHTVTAYHEAIGFQQRVPDESPPFSSPIVAAGGAWLYRFEHEGVYDLYCGPHHILGMVMRIVVGDLDEADYPAYLDAPEEIPPFGEEFEHMLAQFGDATGNVEWVFPTPRETLTASALDPARIQAEGAVPYGAVRDELADSGAETTT